MCVGQYFDFGGAWKWPHMKESSWNNQGETTNVTEEAQDPDSTETPCDMHVLETEDESNYVWFLSWVCGIRLREANSETRCVGDRRWIELRLDPLFLSWVCGIRKANSETKGQKCRINEVTWRGVSTEANFSLPALTESIISWGLGSWDSVEALLYLNQSVEITNFTRFSIAWSPYFSWIWAWRLQNALDSP